MIHLAPDHCRRCAHLGCGCHHCDLWRLDLAQFRAERDAERRGEPIQTTLDLTTT